MMRRAVGSLLPPTAGDLARARSPSRSEWMRCATGPCACPTRRDRACAATATAAFRSRAATAMAPVLGRAGVRARPGARGDRTKRGTDGQRSQVRRRPVVGVIGRHGPWHRRRDGGGALPPVGRAIHRRPQRERSDFRRGDRRRNDYRARAHAPGTERRRADRHAQGRALLVGRERDRRRGIRPTVRSLATVSPSASSGRSCSRNGTTRPRPSTS